MLMQIRPRPLTDTALSADTAMGRATTGTEAAIVMDTDDGIGL